LRRTLASTICRKSLSPGLDRPCWCGPLPWVPEVRSHISPLIIKLCCTNTIHLFRLCSVPSLLSCSYDLLVTIFKPNHSDVICAHAVLWITSSCSVIADKIPPVKKRTSGGRSSLQESG
jgi:hypothetical protein